MLFFPGNPDAVIIIKNNCFLVNEITIADLSSSLYFMVLLIRFVNSWISLVLSVVNLECLSG